jgi:para-nitrobenzyl esterase
VSLISGIDRGDVQAYRGIRFATAERLHPPVDVDRWEPGFAAITFGPQAPQIGGALEQLLGADDSEMSEDCLYLNVVTPGHDDGARPVLVFVHGGAYVTGSGSMPWYDGGSLARRGDVVVVTINYRLGAFGFLGDRNLGSLDQISALRWVQRNIRSFGGDPDDVTIFGESAGGSAVLSLLAAPSAADLFRAVWAMSPSILQLRTPEQGQRMERLFLDQIGPDATVGDLVDMSVGDILAAQAQVPMTTAGLQHFTPTDGTDTFPGPFLEVAANDPRPVVIGTNQDEMLLFTAFDPQRAGWDHDDVHHQFARRFGDVANDAIEAYRSARPGTNPSQLVSAMQTDEVFRQPAQQLAASRAANGRDSWMYLFDQASSAFGGVMGSCHGLDLPFAFDTLTARGAEMFTGPGDTLGAVAEQFSTALLRFARDGAPGWPEFELDRRATQRIGPAPQVVHDPEPQLRRLWST